MMNNQNANKDISVFGLSFANFLKSCGCCGGDREDPQGNQPKQPNQPKNFPPNVLRGTSLQEEHIDEGIRGLEIKDRMLPEEHEPANWNDYEQRLSLPNPSVKLSQAYPHESQPIFYNPLYDHDYGNETIDFEENMRDIFYSEPPPKIHQEAAISSFSKKITKYNRASKKEQLDLKEEESSVGSKKRSKRRPWTAQEDTKLLDLVALHGQSWALLASLMDGRTGKQIRDRYLNNLKPDIKNGNWTLEEDEQLLAQYYKIGHRWSKIATFLPGRTEGQVKNRFYSHIKKKILKEEDLIKFEPLDLKGQLVRKVEDSSNGNTPNRGDRIKTEASESQSGIQVKEEATDKVWDLQTNQDYTRNHNSYYQNNNTSFYSDINLGNNYVYSSTPQMTYGKETNSQNTSLIPENSSGLGGSDSDTPRTSLTSEPTHQSFVDHSMMMHPNDQSYSYSYAGYNQMPQNPLPTPVAHNEPAQIIINEKVQFLSQQAQDIETLLALTKREIERLNSGTLLQNPNFPLYQAT